MLPFFSPLPPKKSKQIILFIGMINNNENIFIFENKNHFSFSPLYIIHWKRITQMAFNIRYDNDKRKRYKKTTKQWNSHASHIIITFFFLARSLCFASILLFCGETNKWIKYTHTTKWNEMDWLFFSRIL